MCNYKISCTFAHVEYFCFRSDLIDEINEFDASKTEEKSIPDYKKTSMKNSVQIFEQFLAELGKENASRRREENGELLCMS